MPEKEQSDVDMAETKTSYAHSRQIPFSLQELLLSPDNGEQVMDVSAGSAAPCNIFLGKQPLKDGRNKLPYPNGLGSFQKKQRLVYDEKGNNRIGFETSISLTAAPESLRTKSEDTFLKIGERLHKCKISKTSPQDYLDALLTSRGYSTFTRRTVETGYYAKPTSLQKASYNIHLIDLARNGKKTQLKKLMECGISSNPCNVNGESLLHIVSRRCDHWTFQILLDAGASLQVSDDYGRTPLHDACWRPQPCFKIIEMIGSRDLNLFHLADSRGFLPLSYVHSDHWDQWIEFIDAKKDIWWPLKAMLCNNNSALHYPAKNNLMNVPPNTYSLPDPENALGSAMATLVTLGKLSPNDAMFLNTDDNMHDGDGDDCSDSEDDYSCDSEEEDYSSCDSEDEYSCDSFSDSECSSDNNRNGTRWPSDTYTFPSKDMREAIGSSAA